MSSPTSSMSSPAHGSSSGMAAVNGTQLYYERAGSGPPLVLIHGYALSTRMWDDQWDAFARQFQVIRFDLRGFGRSALPTGEREASSLAHRGGEDGGTAAREREASSLAHRGAEDRESSAAEPYSYHADLKALLEYLGIERAHIAGLSLGGSIAVNFALAYPEATRSLIAVDVSGLGGYEWPDTLSRWFYAIHTAAKQGDLPLAKQRWLDTDWFTPAREKPAVAARLSQMLAEYSGWHFVHDNPAVDLDPPANGRLAEIHAPTLVVVGERDLPFYNRLIADRLAQAIPGARQVVIPGAGHMANMEEPAAFNRAVLDFLASLDSRL